MTDSSNTNQGYDWSAHREAGQKRLAEAFARAEMSEREMLAEAAGVDLETARRLGY